MLERIIEKRFLKQYKKIYDKINTFNKNNKGRYKDKEELKNHNYYCEELEDFISKCLSSSFKKQYAKIICKHIPELLNNTRTHFWLIKKVLCEQKDFNNNYYKGIIEYENQEYILEIVFRELNFLLSKNNIENVFNTKEFIDHIINSRINNNELIMEHLNEENQKYFIDKCIENKIPIPYDGWTLKYYKGNNKEYLKNHALDIIKYDNAFSVKKLCKNNEELLIKVNNYLDNSPNIIFKSIRQELNHFYDKQAILMNQGISKKKTNRDNINDIIEMLTKEVIEYDKTPVSQINYVFGGYSFVIITNTKVIKVAIERETDKFPDNPYIVKPLIRRKIKDKDEEYFIEVCEKVQTLSDKDISDNELYQIYKNLRELGIIWTDVEAKNVGRLLKDNKIYWKKELSDESVNNSFDGTRGNIVLKKGDFIILDADYMFDENDKNIVYPRNSKAKNYEERYKKEIEQKSDNYVNETNISINNSIKKNI